MKVRTKLLVLLLLYAVISACLFIQYNNPENKKLETLIMPLLYTSGLFLLLSIALFKWVNVPLNKKAEETQSCLLSIINATPDFVGFADAKSANVLYINPAGRRMTGIGYEEDVTKLKISDVHPEWTNKLLRDEIMPAAIRDGTWTGECAFLNRNGLEIPVMMVLIAHKSPNNEVERFSTISRDITEQKKLQEELRQSETMAILGRFAAGAAHEIKNPLGIILGGMEYLRSKYRDADQESKETVKMVTDAVLRADTIINALTALAGPSDRRAKKVDVKALIDDTVSLLKPKLALRKITFATGSVEAGLSIEADVDQIQHALLSILTNAADSMREGGEVTIMAHKEAQAKPGQGAPKCVIEIADTGEGISKENLPRIFEPFFTTKRDNQQVGLGLTVSKAFININRGDISIKSEKGKGTAARIVLPLA